MVLGVIFRKSRGIIPFVLSLYGKIWSLGLEKV
jgi:hypothetical protein